MQTRALVLEFVDLESASLPSSAMKTQQWRWLAVIRQGNQRKAPQVEQLKVP